MDNLGVSNAPQASIVIPSYGRPEYLDVALASVSAQAKRASVEVLVVSDGPDAQTASVAQRHGAKLVSLAAPSGLNAARNAGIEAAAADLIVFLDDDVYAPSGWLEALLAGVASAPDREVYGGPIRARLEGGGPRACGREPPPISTLDHGRNDCDVPHVWGANMAIRRSAITRIGGFDEAIRGRGDEEDWERRYVRDGGRIRYVADAGLDHRRTREDATVRALSRAAYHLGKTARRNDLRKGRPPGLAGELRVLVGCVWHAFRRRCAYGFVMAAHTVGRIREWLTERSGVAAAPAAEDFLSGTSGLVVGPRATAKAVVADTAIDALLAVSVRRRRLRTAVRRWPRRRVLVLAIERTDTPNLLAAARRELESSSHDVTFAHTDAGDRGRFQNLNGLLASHPPEGYDWLLVVDDDVELPRGFLDAFIFFAERFGLMLAQPAHRRRSHAGWEVTRRQPATVVRETAFVEIGPVVAFHRSTFGELLPFPDLRVGWGLDLHWSAVARRQGWRIGVVDATPIQHGLRLTASSYDRGDAVDEARRFLRDRPYTKAIDARRTLAKHRSWS
jgi:GT2 family glycosyltransferase